MKHKLLAILVTSLTGALVLGATLQVNAQVKKTEATETKTEAAAPAKKVIDPNRKLPYNGKIVSVDKAAQTVKISNRTFKVMPDTQITKADKPATLGDAVIGEVTGGSYKNNNGTLELVKMRLGPKTDPLEKTGTTPVAPSKSSAPKKS